MVAINLHTALSYARGLVIKLTCSAIALRGLSVGTYPEAGPKLVMPVECMHACNSSSSSFLHDHEPAALSLMHSMLLFSPPLRIRSKILKQGPVRTPSQTGK